MSLNFHAGWNPIASKKLESKMQFESLGIYRIDQAQSSCYADKHLPNAHQAKGQIIDDASSNRQIICRMFRRSQPRADKEARDE